jgi:hypothetical protein
VVLGVGGITRTAQYHALHYTRHFSPNEENKANELDHPVKGTVFQSTTYVSTSMNNNKKNNAHCETALS